MDEGVLKDSTVVLPNFEKLPVGIIVIIEDVKIPDGAYFILKLLPCNIHQVVLDIGVSFSFEVCLELHRSNLAVDRVQSEIINSV